MKLRALVLLALSSLAFAQAPVITQSVVTGTLQLPPGTPATNTVMRFQLVYCGGNAGRVTNPDGSITIVSFTAWDLRTTNGQWSTNLYGSDQIQCGTEIGTSRWRLTPIFNGINGPSLDYQVNSCGGFVPPRPNGCTFDVDAAPQCSAAPNPISTNCVVQFPYVVPPPEPIQGPPGPAGPPGPPGPGSANPAPQTEIAYYAGPGTTAVVSGNPRFTDDATTLAYSGNGYIAGTQTLDNVLYIKGAWYMDSPSPSAPMSAAPTGRSGMGVDTDYNFYISANGGPKSEICTHDNGACSVGGSAPATSNVLAGNNAGGINSTPSQVNAQAGYMQAQVYTATGACAGCTSPYGTTPNASVEWFNPSTNVYGVPALNGAAAYFGHSGVSGTAGNGGVLLAGGNASGVGTSYKVYLNCEMTGCDFQVPITQNGAPPAYAYPTHFGIYPVLGQAGPQLVGVPGAGTAAFQAGTSNSDVTPTAAQGLGRHFVSGATASTTNAIGMVAGQTAGNSANVPYVSFTRFSTRLSLFALANCRYYWGLSTYNTSGLGGNTLSVLGTAKFTSDTPNTSFIGFRYSNGTDTTFKAVTINPGASFAATTVVDTLVTADTNPHLFEVYPSNNNTVMNFYIDRVLVQSISTNLPPVAPSSVADGFGSLFFTGDNKNTATIVGLNFYSMEVSLKLP